MLRAFHGVFSTTPSYWRPANAATYAYEYHPGQSNSIYVVRNESASSLDAAKRWGILGRINVSTGFGEIEDGTSNTIMTGELQRISEDPSTALGGSAGATALSVDGWAVGGAATMFTTGYNCAAKFSAPVPGLSNNKLFMSPGSEHAGGANYGLADGSVHYMLSSMDSDIFCLMGSMADQVAVPPPD